MSGKSYLFGNINELANKNYRFIGYEGQKYVRDYLGNQCRLELGGQVLSPMTDTQLRSNRDNPNAPVPR